MSLGPKLEKYLQPFDESRLTTDVGITDKDATEHNFQLLRRREQKRDFTRADPEGTLSTGDRKIPKKRKTYMDDFEET